MTLIEALNSGKKFKRKEEKFWTYPKTGERGIFTKTDIVADDWEVEDVRENETIQLTLEHFTYVYNIFAKDSIFLEWEHYQKFRNMLGFK